MYFMIISLLWNVSKIAGTHVIGAADLLALIVEEGTAEHGLPLLEGDLAHGNRIVVGPKGPKVSVPCVLLKVSVPCVSSLRLLTIHQRGFSRSGQGNVDTIVFPHH